MLGVENQSHANCGNEQADSVTPNPRSASEPREKAEKLRPDKSRDGDNQKPVVLKEGLQTVALAMRVHSGLTTQAQRPGTRDATIETATLKPGSLQRMVRLMVIRHKLDSTTHQRVTNAGEAQSCDPNLSLPKPQCMWRRGNYRQSEPVVSPKSGDC